MNGDDRVTDRDKLSGLFRFAQGVLAAKGRVLMRMQDTGLGCFPETDIRDLPGVELESDDETWMRLRRLRETPVPPPDKMIAEWLDGRFDDPLKDPIFKPAIVREAEIEEISDLCELGLLEVDDIHPIDDGETDSHRLKFVLRLENLDELRVEIEKWRRGPWEEWAIQERPIRKSISLYNRLFQLHNMMHGGVTAAPPEVVWGIGIAKWRLGTSQIEIPPIERLVDLDVEKGGSLCIRPREARSTLSLKPFLEVDVDGSAETQRYLQERFSLIVESEDVEVTPFDTTVWENILDAAATRLSPRAKHVTRDQIRDGAIIRSPEEDLAIYSTWTIYGRPRSESLREQDLEALRAKIEKVESDDGLPNSLRGFVAPKPQEDNKGDDWGLTRRNLAVGPLGWSSGSNGRVPTGGEEKPSPAAAAKPDAVTSNACFFPLPYNDEQAQIIDRLEVEDVVTVTGPPGTGKTHSIANIISHFMATGKRVLVTARTAEALAAVREKLPKDLASLVIASVSSDREGAKQLEEAIQKLSDDVVSLDVDQTKDEIARLEAEIVRLDQEMRACDQELAAIALANLAPLTWTGEERTAMELAGILTEIASEHEWMIDRPTDAPPATLDITLDRLRRALPRIAGDVVYIGADLPDPGELPTAAELVEAHRKEREHRNKPEEDFSDQPIMARDTADSETVAAAAYATIDAVKIELDEAPSWERALVSATLRARLTGEPNPAAFDRIRDAARLLRGREPGAIQYDASTVERRKLIEAVGRARAGGKPVPMAASIFNRSLLAAVESVRLDGGAPHGPEAWERVYDALIIEDLRPEIYLIWNEAAMAGQLPGLPETAKDVADTVRGVESRVTAVSEAVDKVLVEAERLKPLFPYGLDLDRVLGDLNFDRVLKALRANLKDSYVPPAALSQLDGIANRDTRPIFDSIRQLREALGSEDRTERDIVEGRGAITAELLRLIELRSELSDVDRDLAALSEAGAPKWAVTCRGKPFEADRILRPDWRSAWDWAVMRGRLDQIIALGNGDQWRDKKAELRRHHERQFELLIRARTLLGLKKRLSGVVQTALVTFTTAVRRLGRGTGKSAVRWRKAIRDAAVKAAPAAPVWVMPEYKIAEQLPAELEDFDLVILDEASQSDVTAIAALARGKKHLIVGDERQVSPSPVGIPQNKIDALRAEYLSFLPNRNVIDENTSVFEIAMQMHPNSHLMLREHFRCAEPIIQFSTRFYNGRLLPLRVPKASERFDPPLVDVFVKGGQRRGQTNEAEAQFIVDEIAAIAVNPTHAHRDVAVISLIGREQAELIERMLIADRRVSTEVMERLRIVCGDSRTMQGQERSVVFLSMVATPETARMQSSQSDAQRFNVALSRARDRLYLVRSVSAYHLRHGDLKLQALEHFSNPMPEGRALTGLGILDRCQSGFEREVCERLLDANYRVRPQVKAGPHSIDLVVEGVGDRRLAIELDGDRWHGPDKWGQDMARQAALERAGWTFWRVFGSQWIAEKEYWWDNLINTMTNMGIEPIGAGTSEDVFTEFREFDFTMGAKKPDNADQLVLSDQTSVAPIHIPSSNEESASSNDPDIPTTGPEFTDEPASEEHVSERLEDRLDHRVFEISWEDAAVTASNAQGQGTDTANVADDSVSDIISRVDAELFYQDDYRGSLKSIGCAIVDAVGPITFKHLCDQIARLHGFRRTGSEIKRTVWLVMRHARVRSRGPDNVEVFWPHKADVSDWIPFRGLKVDSVVRSWSDLPFPEKLGLAREVLATRPPDPELAMSRKLGLNRLRTRTREEMKEVIAVAKSSLTIANEQ